uniref:Protein kinase domain-containing protein n=2 Tax=Parascaris univalens TaxID=6257 RepID=A0A915A4C6_PARUN
SLHSTFAVAFALSFNEAVLDDIEREMQKDDKRWSACSPAATQSEKSLDMMSRLYKAGYISKDVIGRGTYSIVRRAYSERHNKDVALKIVDKRSQSDFIIRFLPRELDIVQRLHHQNIVDVFEIIQSESIVCIAQEYAAGGDLLKKIKKQGRINEDHSRFYFRQLVEALMYLKKIEVVHRDLKCENLFLDLCDNIKLGDFGFSRIMHNGDESHTFCGSRAYVAPEVLRSRSYSGFTVDLWSAGVVLFVMVTGLMPYDDRYPKKMVEKQMQHRYTSRAVMKITMCAPVGQQ